MAALPPTAARSVPAEGTASLGDLERPRKRMKAPLPFECPACQQRFSRPPVLARHLQRCCGDLYEPGPWAGALADQDQALGLLVGMARAEAVLRDRVLDLSHQGVVGAPRPPGVVAHEMGLPLPRVEKLVEMARKGIALVADEVPVEVLYEDEELLVLSKPPHLSTTPKHRFAGGSLVNRVVHHLSGAAPYPLHRLDMNTSGVVLMAKNQAVVPHFHNLFRDQSMNKVYLAVVCGAPPQDSFRMEGRIGEHPSGDRWVRAVREDGAEATTDFRVLSRTTSAVDLSADAQRSDHMQPVQPAHYGSAALLECRPKHGRTHQIRLHAAEAGCPILCDSLYGLRVPLARRQLLHAARISFTHPLSAKPMSFSAPLPADFLSALQALGLAAPQEY